MGDRVERRVLFRTGDRDEELVSFQVRLHVEERAAAAHDFDRLRDYSGVDARLEPHRELLRLPLGGGIVAERAVAVALLWRTAAD